MKKIVIKQGEQEKSSFVIVGGWQKTIFQAMTKWYKERTSRGAGNDKGKGDQLKTRDGTTDRL